MVSMFSSVENTEVMDRSPLPAKCQHPKHPITGHCNSCLIRLRKTVCCHEFPCHRHVDEDVPFWDRVAAHEVTLAQRREKKRAKKLQTPQKAASARVPRQHSSAESTRGDSPSLLRSPGLAGDMALGDPGFPPQLRRDSLDSARSPSVAGSAGSMASSKFLSPSKLHGLLNLDFPSLLYGMLLLICHIYFSLSRFRCIADD